MNGCPKSGTHAVCALLDRMGLKRCPGTILGCTPDQLLHIVGAKLNLSAARLIPDNVYTLAHVCAAYRLDGFPVVTVFRDPRNVLVSYCRHRKREGVEVSIAEALASFWGAPFVAVYRGFLGWAGRSVILRYEEPCATHHQQKRQAESRGKAWRPRAGCDASGMPRDPGHHWNR